MDNKASRKHIVWLSSSIHTFHRSKYCSCTTQVASVICMIYHTVSDYTNTWNLYLINHIYTPFDDNILEKFVVSLSCSLYSFHSSKCYNMHLCNSGWFGYPQMYHTVSDYKNTWNLDLINRIFIHTFRWQCFWEICGLVIIFSLFFP